MKKHLQELQRRNVFRAVAAYIVIGWVLLQVSTNLEDALELPDWFDAVVTALLAIGFPIVVIFSWVYELTPEGVQKTEAVEPSSSIADKTGQRLNYITIAGVVILLGVVIFDRVTVGTDPGTGSAEVSTAAAVQASPGEDASAAGDELDRSIAVLPFVAMTSSQDDEFFADGLSEEILNVLANIEGLKVAGRTSSFYYKGRNEDLREIAGALDVAHILEGSVRRSGDRLRVTAQLIKADDGFHLWSQTFDREDGDTFKIQDEISMNVARALETEILGPKLRRRSETNVEAENFYLIAQAAIAERTLDDTRRARDLYGRAAALDPDDPRYLAGYAQAVALQYWNYRDISSDEAISEAGRAIEKALELETPGADILAIAGLVEELRAVALNDGSAKTRALEYYKDALRVDGDNILALQWLASIYLDINEPAKSLEAFERVVELDPLNYLSLTGLSNSLSGLGRLEEAKKHLFKVQALFPKQQNSFRYLSGIEYQAGRLDKSTVWAERAVEADSSPLELTNLLFNYLALGWADQALETAEAYRQQSAGADISRMVEAQLEKQFDVMAEEAELLLADYGESRFARAAAWAHAKAGNCDRTVTLLEDLYPSLKGEVIEYMDPGDYQDATLLAHCNAVINRPDEAKRLAQMVLVSQDSGEVANGWFSNRHIILAAAHAVAGNVDEALTALGEAKALGQFLGVSPLSVAVDELPIFERLYDESAFQAFAREERYEIARQARLLASGETEQEIVAEMEAAGYKPIEI